MATYKSYPGASPGEVAAGLRFGDQDLISSTQPGPGVGQFLIATSPTTLGWTSLVTAAYADGLNTTTVPIATNSTTPLAGQYLRAQFPTNAIWDYAYMNGVKVFDDTLTDRTTVTTSDSDSIALGAASAIQGVAIGRNATVTVRGVAIGKNTTADNAIVIGNQSSANTGVTIGNQSSSGTVGVAIGPSVTTTGGIGIGGSAVSTTGIAIGNAASTSTGISVGNSVTSLASCVAIGTSVVAQNTSVVVIGINCTTGVQGGGVVVIGHDLSTTTNPTGQWHDSINIGNNNTVSLTNGSASTRMMILGTQNAISSTSGGDLTKWVCVGHGNTQTTATNNADNNLVFGNDNVVNGGTRFCVVIGHGLTTGTIGSVFIGANSSPLNYMHTSGACFNHKVVTANANATSLTTGGIIGGIVTTTLTGPANLQLPTGTAMDSDSNITNNLWVGMCVVWKLEHITNAGVITITNAASGHTYVGPTLAASPDSRTLFTIRTGVNTWVTYG